MSDAKVRFDERHHDQEGGPVDCFSFACPTVAGRRCFSLIIRSPSHGLRPSWEWDGNREAPTFSPSIDCKGCWHGYIRAGRCVTTAGQDEPEPVKPEPV